MSDSDTPKVYRDFWREFEKRVSQREETPLYFDSEEVHGNFLSQKRNLPDGSNYTFSSDTNRGYLQVKLHIWSSRDDRDEIFGHLREHRNVIEAEIGEPLSWSRNEDYDAIVLQREGDISTTREEWDEYLTWLIEQGERFDEVFGAYLSEFKK